MHNITNLLSIFFLRIKKAELDLVCQLAKKHGAFDAVLCNHWAQGGPGAEKLAQAVEKACQQESNFK